MTEMDMNQGEQYRDASRTALALVLLPIAFPPRARLSSSFLISPSRAALRCVYCAASSLLRSPHARPLSRMHIVRIVLISRALIARHRRAIAQRGSSFTHRRARLRCITRTCASHHTLARLRTSRITHTASRSLSSLLIICLLDVTHRECLCVITLKTLRIVRSVARL